MIITEQTNLTYKEKQFCPCCGNESDFEESKPEEGNREIYIYITCEDCGAEWREVYTFIKIDNLINSIKSNEETTE